MPAYPPDTALILIAVITNPRDLEIARLLGWYRIPLRHAPKVVDVDYLAFYQTANFGEEERWQIHYVAPVRGHELTTRAELLRDEPNHPHAREEYFKIQLGPVSALPHRILAQGWRRVTFLYSTGDLLRQAETIHDLVVRDESRAVLWQSLRERAMNSGAYSTSELPEQMLDLDPMALAMLGELGKIKEEALDYD